jgi:signal transduction histidine kinase
MNSIDEDIVMITDYQKDIDDIASIPIISTMLDVICRTTGMGFAAIARVTEDRWITCSVKDEIGFGIKPGGELDIKTTICNEIRQTGNCVVIDNVDEDPDFHDHHTPVMYGFKSYISIPIIRKDGTFFGTLCAIDPKPNILKTPAVTGMFQLFTDLISFHLSNVELLSQTEASLVEEKAFNEVLEKKVEERTAELKENNASLEKMNKELQSFTYISSHDLQEPLQKIKTLLSYLKEKESENLSERGKQYFEKITNAANRMQTLINDLLSYSRTGIAEQTFENINLNNVVNEVIEDLKEELEQCNGTVETVGLCAIDVIPFQFHQLLYNLFSNSIKFARQDINLLIKVEAKIAEGRQFEYKFLESTTQYCHIAVSDNGIGFEPMYSEKIFELFQRLHERSAYTGTGIGLGIVKKIVENHKGHITASAQVNKGATFDVYIPVISSN